MYNFSYNVHINLKNRRIKNRSERQNSLVIKGPKLRSFFPFCGDQ